MSLGDQCVGLLRRHQRLGLDGGVQIVLVEDRQVEAAAGQALHQFLLLAVVDADLHAGVLPVEAGDQPRQVQRRHRLEAADVDLPADHVVVGQGILFELMGEAQQFLRLAVELGAAGG